MRALAILLLATTAAHADSRTDPVPVHAPQLQIPGRPRPVLPPPTQEPRHANGVEKAVDGLCLLAGVALVGVNYANGIHTHHRVALRGKPADLALAPTVSTDGARATMTLRW